MSYVDVVLRNLRRSFGLYDELVATLPAAALGQCLPQLRSNSIGQQLWCVVGARESYVAAFERGGEWAGFSCSLSWEACESTAAVGAALQASSAAAMETLEGRPEWSEPQQQTVCDLMEHEAQHHGQLVRYLYALNLPIPPGWQERYALQP
ncbi:MAG: hypothetical protein AAF581_09735 [Planctomycetota bacterium]